MRISSLFAVLLVSVACNDDKPKTETKSPASAEPIPTDLVYNAGLDDKAAASKITIVSDAGPAIAADSGGPTNATAKLVDPGADPKMPLAYAFAPKARTVTVTMKESDPRAGSDETLTFSFTATPKPKFGVVAGDATLDLKVTKMDVQIPPGAPAQAAQEKDAFEKAVVGVVGHVDITSHGDMSDPQFEAKDPQANALLSLTVLQAIQVLVVPLPGEPVGVGAKWKKSENRNMADEGMSVNGATTMTLVARDTQTATIKVEQHATATMTPKDPRAPKGTTVTNDVTGNYTIVIRLDGVAQKADGNSTNSKTQKVPGQPDQSISAKVALNVESK